MVRTKRSATLDSKTSRLKLEPGKDHTEPLASGRYLVYRRPLNGGSGTWSARFYDPATGKIKRTSLGAADDFVTADAVPDGVLTYQDATDKADIWFTQQAQLAHLRETGERVSTSPLTVDDCLDALLQRMERNGQPTGPTTSFMKSRIRPQLGLLPVSKLSRKKIEEWLVSLGKAPKKITGQKHSRDGAWDEEGPTEDQLKARRSTANRILTILKAALNQAVNDRRYIGPQPWKDVRPLAKAGAPRVRFLSNEEQTRLVNACPADFRCLVLAALYTGSRFGPLSRLKAKDVDLRAEAVWIEGDKGKDGGKSRWIHLAPEALEWFRSRIAGLLPDALVFRRMSAPGRERRAQKAEAKGEQTADPLQWAKRDYTDAMAAACDTAKVGRLTFHELRHTYASMLVNAGVPLAFVAEQLGHVNTRMVEKHYGHLCPSAKALAIKQLTPQRGLSAPLLVDTLKTKKG